MKKQFLLLLLLAFVLSGQAQVFVENFATAPVNGNLEGYNGWYVSFKSSDALGVSPVIKEDPLFFTGYPGSNIGHVAVLDSAIGATSSNQRISTKKIIFAPGDTMMATAGTKFYSAFIVNVEPKSYRSYRDFFTYEGSATSSMTRGRVFAKNNTAGNEVVFAVTKNSSSSGDYKESTSLGLTLNTGVNHLLVLKYEVVDGDSNDKLTLFVNPDPTKTEAEQTNKLEATDVQTDYSATAKLGINLRQRGIGATVGGIRVGKSWNAVVMGQTSGLDVVEQSMPGIWATDNIIVTSLPGNLEVFSLTGTALISTRTEGRLVTNLRPGIYIARFKPLSGAVTSAKIQIW